MANISAGNAAVNQKGIGAKAIRQGLYEEVLGIFGYQINIPDFQHFKNLGTGEHVAIVGGPLAWRKDFSQSFNCNGQTVNSNLFGNLYTPIWDGGANGTPYNDDNYFAAYLYQVVNQYKDDVRFWEIWNEPGLDLTGNLGWRDQNFPGNWWLEGPNPCDNIMHAPIYNYIRTLRIAWEIIKTVDPDGYVCLGSVGYQSYMNALLRNTDNPNNGDVSAAYPLTGGAYFDGITYHSYPHFDGSTTNFDQQFFERHSDEAADGIFKYRNYYQQILTQYGYDGVTFPKKEWIMTETNSPRKVFGEAFPGSGLGPFFGGADQQINHMMKAFMVAKVNNVHQMHSFQLIDQTTEAAANYEFHLMGMYKTLNGAVPYNVQVNDLGKAMKTMSDMVWDTELDVAKTAAMNLPAGVRGFAFRRPDGTYVYAIWARTTEDLSENAFANYSFPASFNMANVVKYNWDFGYTNATQAISSQNIQLNARPVFFTAGGPPPACQISPVVSNVVCNNNGTPSNAADDTFTFTLTVNGTNTSGNWTATINGQTVNGTIGTPVNLGPFAISGGNIFFAVRDASNPACANETVANAPATCSNVNPPPGNYCDSKSDFPWHDWIAGVQIGTINNPSSKQVYSNFTSQTTNLAAGTSNPISLTAGFSWFTFNENWRIWIDFNKNGTFEASEKVFEGVQNAPAAGTPSAIFNGNLTIPAGSATGSTRMRISMKRGAFADPCELLPFGEVEDYNVNITGGGGNTCSIAATTGGATCNDNGTATNAADDTWTFNLTVTGTNTGAAWTATINGQNTTGQYGTPKSMGPYPIAGGNLSISIKDNTTFTCITSTSATAPATCSNGGTPGTYCGSTSDFPWHDWIAGVKIGSINSPSGKSAYSDFTAQTTDLSRGQATPIVLTAGFSWFTYNEYWKIWIDFNKNGTFEEPSELVFSGILNKPADGTASAVLNNNFTVPANATPGSTRMRVSMKRDAYATSCEKLPFGEVEDYTVNILPNLIAGNDSRAASDISTEIPAAAKIENANFGIYPNPAQQNVWVNLKSFSGRVGQLNLFNSQGLLVSTLRIDADSPQIFEIDLAEFQEGYYFLQLRTEGKRPVVQKLTILKN